MGVLVPSRYNYLVRGSRDLSVGYNFLTRASIKLPNECLPILESVFERTTSRDARPAKSFALDIGAEPLRMLASNGFLVDNEFDETIIIKNRFNRSVFANDRLNLIILPTLWCNLKCPYCFELKKSVFMNKTTADALMDWIETEYDKKRFIHFSWFGGEPLLGKKIIYYLSERIIDFSKSIGAEYRGSITTNGFYLDEEFCDKLEECKIANIQITLDGYREDHDALRMQHNGRGSFDKIISNILGFCKRKTSCKMTIRINCGTSNYGNMNKLIDTMPDLIKQNTNVFFRWIWSNEATQFQDFSSSARGEDAFSGLAALYERAQRQGWKTTNPVDHLFGGYCEVDYTDHYSVGPDGSMFLCTHTFRDDEAVGSVSNYKTKGRVLHENKINEYQNWYAADGFSDSECKHCLVLPICKGGCRKARFNGGRECISEKNSPEKYVRSRLPEDIRSQL